MDTRAIAFELLRSQSEERWENSVIPEGVLGHFPSTETRWRDGLSEREIDACEARYGLRFPSSFRAMLSVMGGTTDWLMVRGTLVGDRLEQQSTPSPGFLDPRFDEPLVRARRARLPEQLWPESADVRTSGMFWPRTFGPKPDTREERLDAIRAWLDRAPPAWPLLGHRFAILDESTGVLPVLSIWHCNDTIVYGEGLEDYLIRELGLGLAEHLLPPRVERWSPSAVPYWGELVG